MESIFETPYLQGFDGTSISVSDNAPADKQYFNHMKNSVFIILICQLFDEIKRYKHGIKCCHPRYRIRFDAASQLVIKYCRGK